MMNPDVKLLLKVIVVLLFALLCVVTFGLLAHEAFGQERSPGVPFPQGEYNIATDSSNILVIFTHDQIVENKKDVLVWSRGGFDKDQKDSVVKLVKRLIEIRGITNVIAAAYRLEVTKAQLYNWNDLIPEILEVFKTSELETLKETKHEANAQVQPGKASP